MPEVCAVIPSVPFKRKEPRMTDGECYDTFRKRRLRNVSEYNDYRVMWSCTHVPVGKPRRFAQAFWGVQIRWMDL